MEVQNCREAVAINDKLVIARRNLRIARKSSKFKIFAENKPELCSIPGDIIREAVIARIESLIDRLSAGMYKLHVNEE